jgi:hypothetical protein
MKFTRLMVLVAAISLAWTTSAGAMTCREWNRLLPDQKASSIDRMIADALASQKGRNFQINRGAIGRCLYDSARDILYDFDDTCASSRTSGMQALNTLFKNYIWSCVN